MGELYRSLHYEVTEDAAAEIVRLRRTSGPFEQIVDVRAEVDAMVSVFRLTAGLAAMVAFP